MFLVLLSLGAIYAFIPVVIIIVLLLAGRSAIGGDFFEIFGIGTLLGLAGGVGRGSSGKGLRKGPYKTNTARTNAASGAVGSAFLGHQKQVKYGGSTQRGAFGLKRAKKIGDKNYHRILKGDLWQSQELDSRIKLQVDMHGDPVQIREMINKYASEKDKKLAAGIPNDQIVDFALVSVSFSDINKYYVDKVVKQRKPGDPGAPPSLEGGDKGFVHTAIPNDFYSQWWKARGSTFEARKKLNEHAMNVLTETSNWTSDDLREVLRRYTKLPISPDTKRGALVGLVINNVSEKQLEEYVRDRSREKRVNQRVVTTPNNTQADPGSVLSFLNNNKWNIFINPGFEWLRYQKGNADGYEKGGYGKNSYKVFVQPTADKFVDYVDRVSKTLDGMIEKGEISGAKFKFSKVGDTFNREELGKTKDGSDLRLLHGEGADQKRLNIGYEEKIVIYARSPEEMEKIVKGLNSTFKSDAYKDGTEKNLDAYSLTNGAKWTYGINPLIHVRRGGAGNHDKINNERIKKGEVVDKPQDGWDIPKDVIDRLRLDSKNKAGMS